MPDSCCQQVVDGSADLCQEQRHLWRRQSGRAVSSADENGPGIEAHGPRNAMCARVAPESQQRPSSFLMAAWPILCAAHRSQMPSSLCIVAPLGGGTQQDLLLAAISMPCPDPAALSHARHKHASMTCGR